MFYVLDDFPFAQKRYPMDRFCTYVYKGAEQSAYCHSENCIDEKIIHSRTEIYVMASINLH